MNKTIQIFKAGKHTAMSGATLEFTESDLTAAAKAYDPAIHEAPIVVGHPSTDAPAYGWVKALQYAEDGLQAEPQQVDPDFAELVKKGRYKKISASFYTPTSPNNPVPGAYYLRHVGFLGAHPPAVKGLKQVEFADTEQGVVEFGDWDDKTNARLWRGLRDWVIGKFGNEEADKAVPSWDVQSLADSAAQPEPEDAAEVKPINYQEPNKKGDEMSAEEKARLTALEQENNALKAEKAEFAEVEKKRKTAAAHADHLAFADGLVKAGALLPAHKDVAVATMDFMACQETTVEFGEGDDKKPLLAAFREYLSAQPKRVEFAEIGGGAPNAADALSDTQVAQRAREYKARRDEAGNSISFAEAVDAVRAGKDKE